MSGAYVPRPYNAAGKHWYATNDSLVLSENDVEGLELDVDKMDLVQMH